MPALPPELGLANLLKRQWPDDATILDLRQWLQNGDIGKAIVRGAKVSVHSLAVDVLRNDGTPWPNDMTLAEMRELVPPDSLNISFRDGGVKARTKPRELV